MQAKILIEQIGKRKCKQRNKELRQQHKLSSISQFQSSSSVELPIKTCHQSYTRSNAHQPFTSKSSRTKKKSQSKRFFIDRKRDDVYSDDTIYKRSKGSVIVSEKRIPDPGIFCICKGVDDGVTPMLQCDTCKDWFHFGCVNIPEGKEPKIYSCPNCKNKGGVSPLDLLILAAENMARCETSEVKSELSESKSRSIDEHKETTQRSCDELEAKVPERTFHLSRAGQTSKLVLENPK